MSEMLMLISTVSTEAVRADVFSRFFGDRYMLTYIMCLVALIFSIVCSIRVNTTYNKYSKINSRKHMPAWQVARQILDNNGLYDVSVVHVSGHLTDNFNPRTKVVSLSDSVYDSTSLAAIGVAAHKCGHAIQHAKGYVPIKVRSMFFPVAQIGSKAYFLVFLLGLLFNNDIMVNLGIILFSFVVLFQLITLPVEFNASRRAMNTLEGQLILDRDELAPARKTLSAAAMTYVASLLSAIMQLLRLIARAARRR